MADEEFNNQRPAIIVAVILAALTAAGLWYFFVFRSSDLPETAQETPVQQENMITQVTPQITPTPTALSTPRTARITPVAAQVHTTAPTGPAETTAVIAFGLTVTGLLGGLFGLRQRRAI